MLFKIKTKFALNGNSLHQGLVIEMTKVHSVISGESKRFNQIETLRNRLWNFMFPPEGSDSVVMLGLVYKCIVRILGLVVLIKK